MSSDDVGNDWVETVPNGESKLNAGGQKPNSLLSWLIQPGGGRLYGRYCGPEIRCIIASMRLKVIGVSFLLFLVAFAAGAQDLVHLDVQVTALGRGTEATVMGVTIQVAPQDRAVVGNRVKILLSLHRGDSVIDALGAEIFLESNGSATLYREWPQGRFELQVTLASTIRAAFGVVASEVEVPEMKTPFEAPVDAPADAIALEFTPPRNGAVRFVTPREAVDLPLAQFEVEVPGGTASVDFLLDSRLILRRDDPPWSATVNIEEIVGHGVLGAIAHDTIGRYLGEDALVLSTAVDQIAAKILLAPPRSITKGKRTVRVAVSGTRDLHQVSLRLDDEMVAHWAACPCVTEISVDALRNAAVLVAEVVGAQGRRSTAVHQLFSGFSALVEVEVVEVPLTVLDDHGIPVTGLDRTDFTIFEDGQAMEIGGFGSNLDLPLSLVVAVDISGSMATHFNQVRHTVTEFAENLVKPVDQVTLIGFAAETEILVGWTNSARGLETSIYHVAPQDATALYDAVILSLDQFRGRRGRQALVLITDGKDTSSHTDLKLVQRFARTMRVPIFPIGIRIGSLKFKNRHVLKSLAEESGGRAFFPRSVSGLPTISAEISGLLRSQYVLWYRPELDKPPGVFRSIRVSVNDPRFQVRTIHGYYPGK